MPGLVGFTHERSETARDVLLKMQDMLTHESSYIVGDAFLDDCTAVAASQSPFRRERRQPWHDGEVYVWLYGEFYNQDKLTRGMNIPDDDAAILASLYRDRPDFSFLAEIDGFFAAVIYDTRIRKMHLTCDRYGLHQLFWTIHDGNLAWSSELKAFLSLPGYTPHVDPMGVRQFLSIGYMLENRTWYSGVELVPTGTVLTWDIRTRNLSSHRYWWWDSIKPMDGPIDECEVAEEMGRVFRRAVERRVGQGERVGVTLSGGLDSRAILAAMPGDDADIHAVTIGHPDCDDMRFARKIAAVRGAHHHVLTINEGNWLSSRVPAVWWTDGHDMMHMQMLIAGDVIRSTYDIDMNGFAGGSILGGAYLDAFSGAASPDEKKRAVAASLSCDHDLLVGIDKYLDLRTMDYYMMQNRMRRMILGHTRYLRAVVAAQRMPFYDNELVSLAYSLPDELRRKSRIYNRMLLSTFPSFCIGIPWQKTCLPIGDCGLHWHARFLARRLVMRIAKESKRIGIEVPNRRQTYDYDRWLRYGPSRTFFANLFSSPNAIYPVYVSREKVWSTWERHLAGEDHSRILCRYATLEIWLQQIFTGEFRPVRNSAFHISEQESLPV